MIAELFAVWRTVLTRPSVQTFEEQKASASSERTLTGVIIAAVVAAVLSAVLTAILASFASFLSNIGGVPTSIAAGPLAALSTLVRTFVQTIVGFYLFCYVLQFVATRFLGGHGNFDQQAYLVSTYWVPVSIISQVLAFIPCIGWLAALALLIYALVLTTYAVQSGQGMVVGNAIINWIIAAVVTGIVLAVLSAISGGWL
ncbi:MAG: hypothetical protein EPO21_04185 [Chloroflexota bacterium]|nr:MAG: hypothetical protein EPO21_04185 [Chloroflexota bacterium]